MIGWRIRPEAFFSFHRPGERMSAPLLIQTKREGVYAGNYRYFMPEARRV